MSLSKILAEESLLVGYRFRPTDEELINHYLKLKINGDEKQICKDKDAKPQKWEFVAPLKGFIEAYVEIIQQPYVWSGEPELLMASHVLK
ncbi:NAC domain-containing protein 14 [Camellia lanceoleosa]|uniref:NAC domain-containing protein 14 n=1 Tax=Camellia lanceoleosa TaxID=1840588 RepID=A0ACC0F420_9ERIC|nr:NAC domain-containing protein 14 [Camellia lanceoleosa]